MVISITVFGIQFLKYTSLKSFTINKNGINISFKKRYLFYCYHSLRPAVDPFLCSEAENGQAEVLFLVEGQT
jgi:hypothetical protein